MSQRKKFALSALSLILIASVITTLFIVTTGEDTTFFYTVEEVISKPELGTNKKIRVMGMVEEESLETAPDGLSHKFLMNSGGEAKILVDYTGVLPDMFRPGSGVVAEGFVENGEVRSKFLMVKHTEDYKTPNDMPGMESLRSNMKMNVN